MSEQQLSDTHHPRPQWRSRMGFILAAIGSAVGLGNIWRFSYISLRYCVISGGDSFNDSGAMSRASYAGFSSVIFC